MIDGVVVFDVFGTSEGMFVGGVLTVGVGVAIAVAVEFGVGGNRPLLRQIRKRIALLSENTYRNPGRLKEK